MNKRTRLLVLLAVIALCFVFLWPSISWYGRTPKEVQQLALGSTENIKNYAELKAAKMYAQLKKWICHQLLVTNMHGLRKM